MAIKVCIISAFSTATKGLKRPFKNPSHMRICNNLERALVSDIYFYFHLANVRHYYENAGLLLSEYSACFNKGLLTLETCWRKFKLQIPEISGFSYVFSSYYRTTMWRNVSKSSRLYYVGNLGLNVFVLTYLCSKEQSIKLPYARNYKPLLNTKGQIISKCPYEIIVYPKIATKKFPRFLP